MLLSFAERNPGMTRVIIGDALVMKTIGCRCESISSSTDWSFPSNRAFASPRLKES
jgi:hypothetical protein